MKHTPGPWKIVDSIYNPEAPEIQGNGIRVCNMTHGAHGQTPEGKANTKLISLAPDMLSIIQQFIHSVEHEGVIEGRVVDAVRNAKELINKLK